MCVGKKPAGGLYTCIICSQMGSQKQVITGAPPRNKGNPLMVNKYIRFLVG